MMFVSANPEMDPDKVRISGSFSQARYWHVDCIDSCQSMKTAVRRIVSAIVG
jgi:hypothetical protein